MGWKKDYHPIIEEAVAKAGSVSALARETGIARQTISKWLAKTAGPTASNLAKIMAYMSISPVQVGQEAVETVSFASLEWEGVEMPSPSEYKVVPVLADPNRIDGCSMLTPRDNIARWALPSAEFEAMRNREYTVAIEVKDSSMQPLLGPGSLVYVDREDTAPCPGGIFLVRDADTNTVCLRRVYEKAKDGDVILYYAANDTRIEPCHFSINKDFGGQRCQAILGRAFSARVNLLTL